jgi:two-component system copper resistance phosphate regulon response regulator CusR
MRLLLVEDELEIQSFVEQSLIDLGYEVLIVNDARSAFELVDAKAFNGFIVDLGLPI